MSADTVVRAKDELLWYHWNHVNTTYFNDTLRLQGVDPATPGLADMFTGRAFGGSVKAAGLSSSGAADPYLRARRGGGARLSRAGLELAGASLSSVTVNVTLLARRASSTLPRPLVPSTPKYERAHSGVRGAQK